jgi:hypothetical protein
LGIGIATIMFTAFTLARLTGLHPAAVTRYLAAIEDLTGTLSRHSQKAARIFGRSPPEDGNNPIEVVPVV